MKTWDKISNLAHKKLNIQEFPDYKDVAGELYDAIEKVDERLLVLFSNGHNCPRTFLDEWKTVTCVSPRKALIKHMRANGSTWKSIADEFQITSYKVKRIYDSIS